MSVNLFQLLDKFRSFHDVETAEAFFKTKAPAIAPEAYLNIIFKAPSSGLVSEISEELKLPTPIKDFYKYYNGARLFVNGLAIYGCVPKGTPLNRSDRFKILPFDIREVNEELGKKLDATDFLCIGSYGYDQSLVCIERTTGEITCFVGENISKERMHWQSFNEWLSIEVQRISFLFDPNGNCLVDEINLLPLSTSII